MAVLDCCINNLFCLCDKDIVPYFLADAMVSVTISTCCLGLLNATIKKLFNMNSCYEKNKWQE